MGDGLGNGANGTLCKRYSGTRGVVDYDAEQTFRAPLVERKYAKRVWIRFQNGDVGKRRRAEHLQLG